MKKTEEMVCEPITHKIKGFTHQVRLGKKVVALTADKKYGDILAFTMTRTSLMQSLDQKTMFSLALDLFAVLATAAKKRGISPTKPKIKGL